MKLNLKKVCRLCLEKGNSYSSFKTASCLFGINRSGSALIYSTVMISLTPTAGCTDHLKSMWPNFGSFTITRPHWSHHHTRTNSRPRYLHAVWEIFSCLSVFMFAAVRRGRTRCSTVHYSPQQLMNVSNGSQTDRSLCWELLLTSQPVTNTGIYSSLIKSLSLTHIFLSAPPP